MAGSLRDQLIKSGLVTVDRARKVERQARAEKQGQRKGGQAQKPEEQGQAAAKPAATEAPASVRDRARQLNAQKAERARAEQRVVNDKIAERALRAELKQLIHRNDQKAKIPSEDDVPYNFLHGKKVKRIYVTPEQRAKLSSGSLVIVNDDGRYHLVASEIAERVRARDPKRIIAAHQQEDTPEPPPEPGSDAEYYARFKVPDDLDW
jgi:uncharacterized protein YaiL (DUF2058 family)